jgi:hypothetical protein
VGACRRSRGSSPPCMNPRHRGRVLYGALARRPRRLAFRGPRVPPLVTAVAAGATAPSVGSGESLAVGCAVAAPSPLRTSDPGGAVRRIAPGDPYSTFCALLCASKHHCRPYLHLYCGRIRLQPRWRENDWYFPGVRGPVPSAGIAHEGTRIGSRNICQGGAGDDAEYERRSRHNLRLGPACSRMAYAKWTKIRKVSKKWPPGRCPVPRRTAPY